ncbi:MAG: hypothetical protein AB1798_17400 [Spirochaetota bacterium]
MSNGMSPKTIRIKKDSEQEIVFRYRREDRLSRFSAPRNIGKKKVFFLKNKKNRPFLLLIFNLILLIFLVYKYKGTVSESYRGTLSGYSLFFRVYPLKGELAISLSVKLTGNDAKNSETLNSNRLIYASCFLADNPEKGIILSGSLPEKRGEEKILRDTLQYAPVYRTAKVTVRLVVTIGDMETTLTRSVNTR